MHDPGAILVFTYKGDGEAALPPSAAGASAEASAGTGGAAASGAVPTFTAAQVELGKTAYLSNCATCHGQNLVSATYGTPLAGPYFEGKWGGKSVGALYRYAHDRMPPSRPGALPAETYAGIVAYILSVNGTAAGQTALPADAAALDGMTIGGSGG
jgi:mono/diheme cytochrome c family protein